jgi:hypothetical protein
VNEPAIVRLASIPHGVTVVMQGPNPGTKPTSGKPNIPPLTPFSIPGNVYPGLSPIPFPGPYAGPPPLSGPNPLGVGIQPIELANAPGPPPVKAGAQHVIPEININADVLVPPPPTPPLPATSPLSYQSSGPFPESFQGFINDPNSVLRDAIADQDILGFIAINLTTDSLSKDGFPTLGVGSLFETVSQIPFLGVATRNQPPPLPTPPATAAIEATPIPNAFVYSASATFWIEWGRDPGTGPIPLPDSGQPSAEVIALEPFWGQSTHLQLQYSQLVILIFNNVLWPHVTVATMTLSAG